MPGGELGRRTFVGAVAAAAAVRPSAALAAPVLKTIPSSGERIPAIGMGSWLTFDVVGDRTAQAVRVEVLRAFFAGGGRLIDSSPMYGSSQGVIGASLARLGRPPGVFAADKVWTTGAAQGLAQIAESRRRWGVPRFDLLQIHNLTDWRARLRTLLNLKAERRVRYVGVTTYDGLNHAEIEAIMKSQPIDFIQLTYNLADRRAEARLLPLAADRGIGVIVNRPFQEGRLIDAALRRPLPAIATEAGAANWAQFLLKFIVAHPAVTAAIPATRRVDHMRQNIGALAGPLPDTRLRQRMAAAFA